jgi:5-formyltetrahydrofolate cyclo-ligase
VQDVASPIAQDKAALRTRMRSLRAGLEAAQLREWSISIHDRVLALPVVQSAGLIHTFVGALPGEVETRELIEALLRRGTRVACPRVVAGKDELAHYEVVALDDLVQSGMGLWEPDPSRCNAVSVDELDVVLTPGLAFNREGHRLGMGGGYYDRLLANSRATSVGLGFGIQLVEEVPRESHDEGLDWVVTNLGSAGGGVFECQKEREG